jgi:UDP-N-acetyl-2-amino-2-deoxyglucuronate dehydrogenase
MKRFAIIGIAGYIAPRHLKAIKDTGNDLVAAYDPNDSVGVLDSYFPNAAFFTTFTEFDDYISTLKCNGGGLDYLVICSPNYTHSTYIKYGLQTGIEVICEKPLVISVDELAELSSKEEERKRIWCILQMRLHPEVLHLKNHFNVEIKNSQKGSKREGLLTYITPRGHWYFNSWKGDDAKSGGILTNIGIHLFDMLIWIFGPVHKAEVCQRNQNRASGTLSFADIDIHWFLSIEHHKVQKLPCRQLLIEDKCWNFSEGFTDLHTLSYEQIMNDQGYGVAECKNSIELVEDLRQMTIGPTNHHHPYTKLPLVFPSPMGEIQP